MDIITKEELEEKFKILNKIKPGQDAFYSAKSDYLKYIGESKELARIIRKLALDKKIAVNLLQEIFNLVMPIPVHYFPAIPSRLNITNKPGSLGKFEETKVEYPPFWTEDIEEKFHLHENFLDFMESIFGNRELTKKISTNKNNLPSEFIDIKKLHKNIIEKIYPAELLRKKAITIKIFEFDENKSILKINDDKVPIKKSKNQFILLRILFSMREEWENEIFYSEIASEFDPVKAPPIKTIYNAAYQLKKQIASKTDIKDFFLLTNQSLTINNDYFPIN